MFGSYAEVVACVRECEQSEVGLPNFSTNGMEDDIICMDIMSSTNAFGGFKTWPNAHTDFVLIAECSEICGPNPLFTIPNQQHININLNLLSIQILSVDYQGIGSEKNIQTKPTQLVMPDIMNDVHAAINHFVLFDPEARGYIRPLCIAYVTEDKHKLIEFAEPILKCLAEASSFIQYSNRKFCSEKLQNRLLDLQYTKSVMTSDCTSDEQVKLRQSVKQKLKFYDELIESYLQDIQDTLNIMQLFTDVVDVEKFLKNFIVHLSKSFLADEVLCSNKLTNETVTHEPRFMKLPVQHNFDKQLKHLLIVSPQGVLLGIYHLYIMHKYFRRKYENIIFHSAALGYEKTQLGKCLHFGACVVNSTKKTGTDLGNRCNVTPPIIPSTLSPCDNRYFNYVGTEYCGIISNFLKSNNNASNSETENDIETSSVYHFKKDSSASVCEETYTRTPEISIQDIEVGLKSESECYRHIVKLNEIWDVFDYLKYDIPEVESVILEVLQICNKTESFLFSLLTHMTIVIAYSSEDDVFVKSFVRALSAIVPRSKKKEMCVEHDKKIPLDKKDLKTLSIVTFCLPLQFPLANFVASELLPFVTILNLKENTYSGPKYLGCLLAGTDEKIRHMSLQEPVFSVFISILAEIEMQVKLWQSVVSSSMNSTVATHYMLQKGFTSCDIKIVENLSRLCEN